MRKVIENMICGADQGVAPILAAAVTGDFHVAVATFVAATDHNGAYAPRALRELIEAEPERLTPESLSSAIAVANATADWRAGGLDSWPNPPAEIESGRIEKVLGNDYAVVLNGVAQAGGPERAAYDHVHWWAYVFGSGRSRVALIVPALPDRNERRAPMFDQYAVVAYLIDDDGSEREARWGYRMAPIQTLATR